MTPPPTTVRLAGSPDVMGTNVFVAGALESWSVSGVGTVGALVCPTSTKLVAGANPASPGAPRTTSAAPRGSSFELPLR